MLGYTKVGSGCAGAGGRADPRRGAGGQAGAGHRGDVGDRRGDGRSFADLGATVHLLGRNPDKSRAPRRRAAVPNAEVVEEVCDVSDLDAVREWAADLTGRVPALHGLVHNAGTMTEEREENAQGHELQLATHVLGPHLMTELLEDAAAPPPAVGRLDELGRDVRRAALTPTTSSTAR